MAIECGSRSKTLQKITCSFAEHVENFVHLVGQVLNYLEKLKIISEFENLW